MSSLTPSDPGWDARWCGWNLSGGRYCRRWTMIRIDGTRTRYCPHHQPTAVDAALVATKGHSYIFREELSAKVRHFMNEVDLLDLREEMALARSYLNTGLQRWAEEGSKVTFEEIGWVFEKIDRLTQMIERVIRIRNETALTAAEIHYLQIAIGALFQKWVPLDDQRRALEDLYKMVSEERGEIDNRDFLSPHGTIVRKEKET